MSKTTRLFTVFGMVLVLTLSVGLVGVAASDKPSYTFATEAAWAPWDYYNEAGDLVGIDIEIIKEIAKVEGFNVKFTVMSWSSLIPAVKMGKADMTGGGMTITEEREEQVDFTEPYWFTKMAVMVHEDADLNIFSALTNGAVVGNQSSTTWEMWVQKNLIDKGYDVKQKLYETAPQVIQAVISGKVDSCLNDLTSAERIVAKGKSVKIVGSFKTKEAYGYAVKEGNDKLLNMLNDGIEKLKQSGRFDEIVNKYGLG